MGVEGHFRAFSDMGGYYHPDKVKVGKAMRPSATLNAIITNMTTFV